jgi:hypothetical protein
MLGLVLFLAYAMSHIEISVVSVLALLSTSTV